MTVGLGLTRDQLYKSWVVYYRKFPRESALEHCRAFCDILEVRLRALGRLRGYTNHLGMNKRALVRLVGLALGVHKQIGHQIGSGKLLMSLTDSGKLGVEGGNR